MAEKKAPETIKAAYEEARGAVPYATFMKCFNALLDDPAEMEPKQPEEDLYPYFEAVCMAFDLGIRDEQDRGDDRRKEFFDHIYPVWREQVPAGRFHHMDQILEGSSELKGSKSQQRRRQRQMDKAERALDSALKEAGVEDLSVEGIAPDLDDVEPEPEAELAGAAEEAEETGEGQEAGEEAEPMAPVEAVEEPEVDYSSLSKLVQALESGEVEPEFLPAKQKKKEPLATCMFHDCAVELRLVESPSYRYAMLRCEAHSGRDEELMDRIQSCLEDRGFKGPKKNAFMKKSEKRAYRVEVGEDYLRLALRASPEVLKADKVSGAVRALGKLLEYILRNAVRVSA
ncbi:MAG: hypothetical protein V5A84_05290 [Planctomycetota bacterium]